MTTKTWSNPSGNWQNDPNDWSPPGTTPTTDDVVEDSGTLFDRGARLVETALGPEHSRHDAAVAP